MTAERSSLMEDMVSALKTKSYKQTHKDFLSYCQIHGVSRSAVYAAKRGYFKKQKAIYPGGVYFIGCDGANAVKIGWSLAVKPRLTSIATGCPFPVELLAIIETERRGLERYLHERYERSALNGEWFTFSGMIKTDLSDFVCRGLATDYTKETT